MLAFLLTFLTQSSESEQIQIVIAIIGVPLFLITIWLQYKSLRIQKRSTSHEISKSTNAALPVFKAELDFFGVDDLSIYSIRLKLTKNTAFNVIITGLNHEIINFRFNAMPQMEADSTVQIHFQNSNQAPFSTHTELVRIEYNDELSNFYSQTVCLSGKEITASWPQKIKHVSVEAKKKFKYKNLRNLFRGRRILHD